VLPDVPTVGEFVPGYEASAWQGVSAPKNTPAEIVNKLNREINAALCDPKINVRLAELGTTPMLFSPAEFGGRCCALSCLSTSVISKMLNRLAQPVTMVVPFTAGGGTDVVARIPVLRLRRTIGPAGRG
jgi:tripartite-type tricarboxylate transporter receptor subunit TctC